MYRRGPYVVSVLVFITAFCLYLQVLFGTADGQVIVMDCHGRMLAHVLLHESDGIVSMSWNCPDFLVEDSTESDTDTDDNAPPQGRRHLQTSLEIHGLNINDILSCGDLLAVSTSLWSN